MSLGERYSVMIKLDQTPGEYALRFASIPVGDMQQVIEDLAIVRYVSGVNDSSMGTYGITFQVEEQSHYVDPWRKHD